MLIHPLSEGQFTVDQSKRFVPYHAGVDQLRERPAGSLLVEIQPFVVVTSRDIIVLDAGLGYSEEGLLQLHRNLQRVGIAPRQVTKVILSHLHKDHMGGIAFTDDHGVWQPAFAEADYYVQTKEMEYALATHSASYVPASLHWLRHYARTVMLEGDVTIDGYISCALSGGHCPFHQVIWITEGGQTVFYGGDEAPQLQQMKHRFVAKYDKDGKKAMQLRSAWWEQGQQEKWTFLFYHDVAHPLQIF